MSEDTRNSTYDHAFAIVRVDLFHDLAADPETAITVKKVVLSEQFAEEEVSRLNTLNRDKQCMYFWQVTRLERAVQNGLATEAEKRSLHDADAPPRRGFR